MKLSSSIYHPAISISWILLLLFGLVSCGSSRSTVEEEEEEEDSPRWKVKTLTDSDTSLIRFDKIIPSSILEQSKFAPRDVTSSTARLASETSLYEITAWLIAVKREFDGDYHLVIQDGKLRMIAEVPDADEKAVIASGRAGHYRQVKKTIDSLIGERPRMLLEEYDDPPKKIRLIGVGFFDSSHLIGQLGMLANGRELHPVLSLTVLD